MEGQVEFPTNTFGHGFTFRASRTGIPSLYALTYVNISARDPKFHDDPVVPKGGKSKRKSRRKRKSKKR